MESIQGRDGAVSVLGSICHLCPWRRHGFADGGYAADESHNAVAGNDDWAIEFARCPDGAERILCEGV